MNFPFFKSFTQDVESVHSLQQLREHLLNVLLVSAFVIGTGLYMIALIPIFQRGMVYFFFVYTGVYLWLALVAFSRRVSYPVRSVSWLVFCYLLGQVNLLLSGLNADAGLFLLMFVAMAALLFGARLGLLAFGISGVTLAVYGYLTVTGRFHLLLEAPQPTNYLLWAIGGGVFVVTGIPIILSISTLVRGLTANLTKAQAESEKLETLNQALQVSEECYRTLVEISPDMITLLDLDGHIVMANKSALSLLGYKDEDNVKGRHFLEFIAADDRPSLEKLFQTILAGGQVENVECRVVRKDGSLFFAELSEAVFLEKFGWSQTVMAVGRDSTARKRAEDESYKTLLDNSVYGVIVLQDYRIVYANRAITESFGYTQDELGAMTPEDILKLLNAGDRELMVQRLQARRVGEPLPSHYEVRMYNKRGELRFLEAVTLPIKFQGRPALQTTIIDLTERRQMEQALRDAEETSRVILNATDSSLVLMDADGTLLVANESTARRLGKQVDEIVGARYYHLFPEEVARPRMAKINDAIRTGRAVHFEDTRDGKWFESHVYPILDSDARVIRLVVLAHDVTERKHFEEALADYKNQLEDRVAERTWELFESRERLRKLTKEVVLAQEQERRHVSRELHDTAGQSLVSMKIGLESVLAELGANDLPIGRRLRAAVRQVDETMSQVRSLAHSLHPPLLDIADLDLTLQDYCREFHESTGLNIEYIGTTVPDLPEEAGLSFFRFLQEALTNVVKHANASVVRVKLENLPKELSLSVADDGKGQPDGYKEGLGHIGMRERFMMLGGQVYIGEGDSHGFTISASVPWLDLLGGASRPD
jgi:PAS domain S-box-containing protein